MNKIAVVKGNLARQRYSCLSKYPDATTVTLQERTFYIHKSQKPRFKPMLNAAGYEVFHAKTMTRDEALYCLKLAWPRQTFRSWQELRRYYVEPLCRELKWPEGHPFAKLNADQRDNAIQAIEYVESNGVSFEVVRNLMKS